MPRLQITIGVSSDGLETIFVPSSQPPEEHAKFLASVKTGVRKLPEGTKIKIFKWDGGDCWFAPVAAKQQTIEPTIQPLKKMKKFLALIAFAAGLLFAAEVQAQLTTAQGGIVYSNAATTNLATKLVLDVRRQKDVAILLQWKLSGAGTDVSSFHVAKSVDGSTAAGEPAIVFQKASAGATGASITTNITVSGYPYLLVTLASNATAGADITNYTFKYWVKKDAP